MPEKRFEILAPVERAADLWTVDVHGTQGALHVQLRMTVVRLPSGELWLYSPGPIDDALSNQLAELGDVTHIVAPSRAHNQFAGDAKRRYPASTLWVSPGLARKSKGLAFDQVLHEGPGPWGEVLCAIHLRGTPAIDEFAFMHRPSKSAICCDLVFNIREERSWLSRLIFRLLGVWKRPGMSRAWRLATRDKAAAQTAAEAVLAWAPTRIIMAHGQVIEDDATPWLARCLAPLLGTPPLPR